VNALESVGKMDRALDPGYSTGHTDWALECLRQCRSNGLGSRRP
jgi:hypothetical protein